MPAPITLTDEQIRYIHDHCKTMTGKEISREIGLDQGVLYRYMDKAGIRMSRAQSCQLRGQRRIGHTTYTTEEDQYIKDHYLDTPIKAMAVHMGRSWCGIMGRLRQMGLQLPDQVKERNRKTGQFYSGQMSHNAGKPMRDDVREKIKATMFKSGNIPHNTRHDGAISVRKDNRGVPYQFIRTGLGKWESLARYTYRQAHGPIPHGMVIIYKDGNGMNCSLTNLKLITKKENMSRNTIQNYPAEIKEAIHTLSLLKRTIRHGEKQD